MDDLVFRALADPTRRALLDELHARDGQSVSALCALRPEMTRFGVMKHLAILVEANLVTTVKTGRTKRLYLNPVPIGEIAARWISKYAVTWSGSPARPPGSPIAALLDLRDHLERQD